MHQRDWEGAEKEFQAAIRLSPESANAHHWYADFLLVLGRYEEAFAESKRAVELDPNSVNRLFHAFVMFHSGQRERAIADVLELTDREPHFAMHYLWLSRMYADSGDLEKAAAILDRAERTSVQIDPIRLAFYRACVLALQAKTKEAREILAHVGKSPRYSALRALVLHRLGEDREALDLLENVILEGGMLTEVLYHLPSWSKLHGDPRFRAILKSLNLEKYVPIPASATGR